MAEQTGTARINQITEGVIWKQMILFCLPIMAGTLFQQLYNTVDAVVVGRFVGKSALACVGGSSAQLINLIVGFFVGLSSGATVIVGRYYGARDKENLNRALHTSAALSIAGSVLISIAGFILTPYALRWMNTPPDVIAGSTLYMRIYFSGISFVFIYNVGSAILRAMGDSKRPLHYLIICCIINIILDLLLVVGFHLGVAGVAIATLASQAVSAVFVIYALMTSTDLYRLVPRQIRFYSGPLKTILNIGVPAGIQSIMYSIANVIIQVAVNSLGTDVVAANTAYVKLDALYWMISGSFSVAISTFVSQNLGAGKYSRMKRSVRVGLIMDLCIAGALSLLLFVFGRHLFYLFTTDSAVIDIGMQILHIIAPCYMIFTFIEILSSALRGIGDVLVPTLLTCCGICIVRIIWITVAVPVAPGITRIMACYPISWSITAVLFIFYYLYKQHRFFQTHTEA